MSLSMEDGPLTGLTSSITVMLKNNPGLVKLANDNVLGESADSGLWIFQGTNDGKPFIDPLNTSLCAVVVSTWGGWTFSEFHTNNFPELTIAIYADPTRQLDGSTDVAKYDAQSKAFRIYHVIDKIFNDKARANFALFESFDIPIITTERNAGYPQIGPVPDNKGLQVLTAKYAVTSY